MSKRARWPVKTAFLVYLIERRDWYDAGPGDCYISKEAVFLSKTDAETHKQTLIIEEILNALEDDVDFNDSGALQRATDHSPEAAKKCVLANYDHYLYKAQEMEFHSLENRFEVRVKSLPLQ